MENLVDCENQNKEKKTKTLVDRLEQTFTKQNVVGSLGISIAMLPLMSFLQTVVRDHTDWESIKSRVLMAFGTLIATPHLFDFIEYGSSKLGLKKESKCYYVYSGVVGFILTTMARSPINYLAMHKNSSLSDICLTTAIESAIALGTIPLSIYVKKMTEYLWGYTDSLKKIPKWIENKKPATKRIILYVGIAASLLITSGIYYLSPEKKHTMNHTMNKENSSPYTQFIDDYLLEEYM